MLVDNDFLYLCSKEQRYILTQVTNDRIIFEEAEDGDYLYLYFPAISSWGRGKNARDLRIKKIKLPPDDKFHIYDGLEITTETQFAV